MGAVRMEGKLEEMQILRGLQSRFAAEWTRWTCG
jgi:hypothetical protein